MDIDAAQQDLLADLSPLGIPVLVGPLDKDPLVKPAVVVIPPRIGAWVEPGESLGESTYYFDLLYQCEGDTTTECMAQIKEFLQSLSDIKSSWLTGFSIDAPYQVNTGPGLWIELLIHVQDQRED